MQPQIASRQCFPYVSQKGILSHEWRHGQPRPGPPFEEIQSLWFIPDQSVPESQNTDSSHSVEDPPPPSHDDPDATPVKKCKWGSKPQNLIQINIDYESDHDSPSPLHPTPVIEETPMATHQPDPPSTSCKWSCTSSQHPTKESAHSSPSQIEKLLKEICVHLAKQQVSHNDMIHKMQLLAQQFTFTLEKPLSHSTTYANPLVLILPNLGQTDLDLSQVPTSDIPHFITSLVHEWGECQ